MMRRSVYLAGLLGIHGIALALTAAPARAQRERYAPLVLQLPVTARTMAMGGLSVGARDVEAVFGNPALVGGNNAFSLSLGRYPSGASTGHSATTMSVGMIGLGFGVALLDAPQFVSRAPLHSDVLTDDGRVAASNMAATVAASLSWKGFRWGATARYLESRTGAERDGAPAFDVGMTKDFMNGFVTTGVVLQHMGRDLPGDGPGRGLPTRIALGAAGSGYGVGKWFDIGASTNVAVREDGEVFPTAGGELALVPIEGISIALRGGARRPELRAQRALTGGVGLQYDRLSLDYGWEDMRGKGGAHRFTLRIR